MKHTRNLFFVLLGIICSQTTFSQIPAQERPRIANIINFIRQTEPRDEEITDEILYQTVVEEVNLLKRNELKGTFLLQYDALINPKYQKLLKEELYPGSEVGVWWEITQPHIETAGLKWRGRYSWDWHANVGFATGYTPKEREILVDTYMTKFKEVFGAYPTSVGSWFIDAHTLLYMYEKYQIIASCTCKDQIGTDGYTLWGGYWNQAYYPSKKNAYMPAQTIVSQIPIPVFRMLGSDPIYQYDCGLGEASQPVMSLEPVYEHAGGSPVWVDWFLKSIVEEPCLAFAYTQAGQENSFTWEKIKNGLEYQVSELSKLYQKDKIRVETLTESGEWFKSQFPLTPATAVTALTDYQNNNKKTVWYNSRFYRSNLLWEGNQLRIRDIHVFNENYQSSYLTKAGTSTQCIYTTLPIVDGFQWSTTDFLAGVRFLYKDNNGKMVEMKGKDPTIIEKQDDMLVEWPLANGTATYSLLFSEDQLEISCNTSLENHQWELALSTSPEAKLPFTTIKSDKVNASLNGFDYEIHCRQGQFIDCRGKKSNTVLRIKPHQNKIILIFK